MIRTVFATALIAAGLGVAVIGAATASADEYYQNCTAARDAGAAPVMQGDPGYGPHLDRDSDGIGCE